MFFSIYMFKLPLEHAFNKKYFSQLGKNDFSKNLDPVARLVQIWLQEWNCTLSPQTIVLEEVICSFYCLPNKRCLLFFLQSAISFKEKYNSVTDINEKTEEETEKKSEILDIPSQGSWLVFICSTTELLILNVLFCIWKLGDTDLYANGTKFINTLLTL